MSKKNNSWSIGDIIIGIIAVIGFIFFIGELFGNSSDNNIKEIEPEPIKELDKKKERLNCITTNIEELKPIRNQLINTERRILVGSRIVIASLLLAMNVAFLWINNWSFNLGNQLNINGALLLSYSFVAFIIYGNPDTLVKEIKRKSKLRLKRKHIHILSELSSLECEQKDLVSEIKMLEEKEKIENIEQITNVVQIEQQTNTKELVP